jgi:hypothetical protein
MEGKPKARRKENKGAWRKENQDRAEEKQSGVFF